ncbi:MAG: sulfite exporter TauE/SafE family protein [Actinomycetota bacterium]|nr:sulfite exporter TauE/SafE family protein [Actinomycetota bacterium]
MSFEASGIEVFPLVPFLVGFCLASVTTSAGVSGAFLLLPFQVSVLGFTAPGVTSTNLLYNVISTPGGIFRYRQQGDFDRHLVRAIASGAVPGVVGGAVLRVTVFEDPADFKAFVGFALLPLAAGLFVRAFRNSTSADAHAESFAEVPVILLAAVAGTIGGIYGISGGSIIAPALVGVFRLPVRRVAAAALVATFITSVTGVVSFEVIAFVKDIPNARPDWVLATLFGLGGALGGLTGARLSVFLQDRKLELLLGVLAMALAVTYISPLL